MCERLNNAAPVPAAHYHKALEHVVELVGALRVVSF